MKVGSDSFYAQLAAAAFWLAFFAALLPLIFWPGLSGSSEAREAHVVSVIINDGEWVLPLRNGLVPSKPPLNHWLAAAAGRLTGSLDLGVARMPALFLGIGLLVLTFFRAYRLAGASGGRWAKNRTGLALFAAFILASCHAYDALLFDARVDMAAAFFMVLALFTLLAGLDNLAGREGGKLSVGTTDFVVFFAACGLAVLAKGPLGLVLPVILGISALTLAGSLKEALLTFGRPRFAWLIFLAIALPWYYLAAQKGQAGFIDRQLFFENIKRFAGGEDVNNQPFWFYLGSFLRSAFPWSVAFLAVLLLELRQNVFRQAFKGYGGPYAHYLKVRSLYAMLFLAGLLFFSLAAGKRHSYLLPIYPLMSIYLSFALFDWVSTISEAGRARVFSLIKRILAFIPALSLLTLAFFLCLSSARIQTLLAEVSGSPVAMELLKWLGANADLGIFYAAGCGLLSGAAKLFCAKRQWLHTALQLCSFLILLYFLSSCGLAIKAHLKGFEAMAAGINSSVNAADSLCVVRERADEYFDPILYYLGRKVLIVPPRAAEMPCGQPGFPLFFAAKKTFFDELAGVAGERRLELRVLQRVNQRLEALEGGTNREVVVFSCEVLE